MSTIEIHWGSVSKGGKACIFLDKWTSAAHKRNRRQLLTTGKVIVCLCVCICKLTWAYMCMGVYLCTLICIHNSMCSQLLCKEGTVIIFSKTQNWTIWLHQWVELAHDLSLSDSYSSVHYMIFLPLVCHFPKFLSESVSSTLPTNRNNPNCWTDFLPRHVSNRHCQFCCLVKSH